MIVLDMDGVLVDFVGAANALHGRADYVPSAYDYWTDWGLTDDQFWAPINAQGVDFWANIPVYPWAHELIEYAATFDDIAVATATTTNHGEATAGKIAAIRSIFGHRFTGFVVTPQKHLLAQKGRLLIDDHEPNCMRFIGYGGASTLFPRPWNSNRAIAHDPLPATKAAIDIHMGYKGQ